MENKILSEQELEKVSGGVSNEDRLNFPDKIRENPDGRVTYVLGTDPAKYEKGSEPGT